MSGPSRQSRPARVPDDTHCELLSFTDDRGDEQTARIRVHGVLTEEARAALTEIAKAALRKIQAEPPCPNEPACEHRASFHRDGRCVVRRPVRCGCGTTGSPPHRP